MYSVFNILKQNLCSSQSTQSFGEDKYVNTVNKSMKVMSARKYTLYLYSYVKYPKNVRVCMYLCLHSLIYSPCHSYTHTATHRRREIWIPDWFNDTHGENISRNISFHSGQNICRISVDKGASEGVSEAPLAHKIHESNKKNPTGQRIIFCYILAKIYITLLYVWKYVSKHNILIKLRLHKVASPARRSWNEAEGDPGSVSDSQFKSNSISISMSN